MEDIKRLEARIAQLERKLTLGLSAHLPGQMRIYCNRVQCPGSFWYTFNGEPQPLSAACVSGYLTKLEFSKETRRNKEVSKLNIHLMGDRPYLLECGGDSAFAKSVLVAVASLLISQIQSEPIAIAPRPGDDESVLFASVYLGSRWVEIDEDYKQDWENLDWRAIALSALGNVSNAWNVR